MIRTLRAFFLTRQLREKLLLLAFVLIGVLWWGSDFSTRVGQFWRAQRATTATLRVQEQWLASRVRIEAAAEKAASQLESSKTLDRARLIAALNQAAFDAGLRNNYAASSSPSESIGQFTVHHVEYRVTGAEYPMLQQFYLNVQKRAPYLGIDRFTLQVLPGDGSKLILNLRVSSIEFPR
jgi:hypothetical protein